MTWSSSCEAKLRLLIVGDLPAFLWAEFSQFEIYPGKQLIHLIRDQQDFQLPNCDAILLTDPQESDIEILSQNLVDLAQAPVLVYTTSEALYFPLLALGVQDIVRLDSHVAHERVIRKAVLRFQRELEFRSAESEQELFLARLVHDLRAPISTIVGISNLLQEETHAKEQDHRLDALDRSSKFLLKLVNHTLDVAKIRSGKISLKSEAFTFDSIVQDIEAIFRPKIIEKNISLVRSITGQVSSMIRSDPDKVSQILMNLLSNSIKFTPPGGQIGLDIHLKESVSGVSATIRVSDTGIGISEENQRKIFDNYQQASSHTSRHFGGTGLGLGIVKSIVEALKGSITVESELGKGSTFTCVIPFEIDDYSKPIILCAAEESRLHDYMKVFFKEEGYQVLRAPTLARAKESLASGAVDFLVTDLSSPDGVGQKLIDDVGQNLPIPVAVVSSSFSDQDRSRFASRGVATFSKAEDFRMPLLQHFKSRATKHPQVDLDSISIVERPLSILVADDGDDVKLILRAFFKKTQFVTVYVSNGYEAVEMAKKQKFDLVLLDLHMPIMDGDEAIKFIRNGQSRFQNAELPVIAMTAATLDQDVKRCLELGFTAHLPKPLDKTRLFQLLGELYPQQTRAQKAGLV
ncbi:hybrid sensor histidine kinase/response regulator [Pseudobacteriovorax antillogorgiicola]|uniref:histidine kinase n=1 Tax=Pseudobacteriovorax antillogorgiicola TaxID=1513793 RepID=A0A1Y6C429_9BACT|nr:response regulator [Pseudobacteriovorax antillogorgiicola]TCS51281.1 signal transduction histidine kinase [Pseudobacteriovorax antillogorgiicola]SMF36217.1 Signal transduction histidine kinase [Pseudobacteriovorax antillogorgiicola]